MNSDTFYVLLLCLVSGLTQGLLLCLSIYIFRHHRTYLFQRIFAAVLVMHSFGFFNNFVVAACQNLACSGYVNTLLILYDYVIVGGYMMFAVSLVFQKRYNIRELLVLEIPFVAAMLIYAATSNPVVYTVIQIYSLAASLVLFVGLLISIKKYTRMLQDNIGDMEYFDLRWSAVLLAILFVLQLLWAFESISQQTWFSAASAENNLVFDTCYCFLVIAFVMFVSAKVIHQRVFTLSAEKEVAEEDNPTEEECLSEAPHAATSYHNMLLDMNVEKIISERHYYMESDLTLQKLSRHLGTNRQYLSNYINQEKHKTFYVFINDFRLEKAKELIDSQDTGQQYSLEEISGMSGFNSYATFFRAFAKKYGLTPSQYQKSRHH